MKKQTAFVLSVVVITAVCALILYFFGDVVLRAEGAGAGEKVNQMIREIEKEKSTLEARRLELQELESNLKIFQGELERKSEEFQQKVADLKRREEEFNAKVEGQTFDRKLLVTFENIKPAQSAVLLLNLYRKDSVVTTQLMRRMQSKTAAVVLDVMIQIDPVIATELAKNVIDYYRPPVQTATK